MHISQVRVSIRACKPPTLVINAATASKPIDRVLHLQQIVKLPAFDDGDGNSPLTSQATVPAKKPVRQQPKGLRMRFRPIGFGAGKLGKLGSSSAGDTSGSDEEMEEAPAAFRHHTLPTDDETSSDSDEEMEDAPPVAVKPKKSKIAAPQAKSSPLKRKHMDNEPVPKSSSQPIKVLDNTPLKKIKKKQKDSHKSTTDSQSASIEQGNSVTKSQSKNTKHAKLTIPDVASTPILPPSSHGSGMKSSLGSQSTPHKHSKKRSHETEKTPGKKVDLSLHELTKATDPNLTGEERRKKIKKLKHKDSN